MDKYCAIKVSKVATGIYKSAYCARQLIAAPCLSDFFLIITVQAHDLSFPTAARLNKVSPSIRGLLHGA